MPIFALVSRRFRAVNGVGVLLLGESVTGVADGSDVAFLVFVIGSTFTRGVGAPSSPRCEHNMKPRESMNEEPATDRKSAFARELGVATANGVGSVTGDPESVMHVPSDKNWLVTE